ncbi:hypothetical protein NMG60_11032075 [Bertholletia excelsa]
MSRDAISSNLTSFKKTMPLPTYASSTTKALSLAPRRAQVHDIPTRISASDGWVTHDPTDPPSKTPPEFTAPQSPNIKSDVPPEVPRTPNVPDFDSVPPEKPADPPPVRPGPNPEFPGPP